MRNLAILGLALVLVGCGTPEPEKVAEPNTTESKVAVAETTQVATAQAVDKGTAEYHVFMVDGAIDDIKQMKPVSETGVFQPMVDRVMKLKDEGQKFKGTDFDNCSWLGGLAYDAVSAHNRGEDTVSTR